MKSTLLVPTALILATLALAGCSSGGTSTSDESVAPSGGDMSSEMAPEQSDMRAEDAAAPDSTDRQVITTGYVTVTVEDPMDAAAEATRITESVGGRVDGRSEYAPREGDRGSATLTLRLPAATLTDTLEKLKDLGEVQEVSLSATDVTMEVQDLDARISALQASIDRLLALLETATDTESLIQLETAISDRQAQLESMEAQRRYLADQVDLSTVTLNLVTEQVVPKDAPDDFWSGVAAGWSALVAFFSGVVVAIGVVLPWLIPAGIIAVVVLLIVRQVQRKHRAAAASTGESPTSTSSVTDRNNPAP